MKKREIYLSYQIKNGRKYIEDGFLPADDKEEIYRRLAEDLIAKKIHNCSYIKRITFTNHYDGFVSITVYFNNNARCVYTVPKY